MSEQNPISENQFKIIYQKIIRTSESRFFSVFIGLAILSWSIGIVNFQINEIQEKRAIEAAQKAEETANAQELKDLRIAFFGSEYADFDSPIEFPAGEFRWKVNTKSNCEGSRECAYPVVLSLYNCDSANFKFTFTKESGEIVSSVNVTENFVSSLTPLNLYIESNVSSKSDFVNFTQATCNGKSY
jgi:hypothetical protein